MPLLHLCRHCRQWAQAAHQTEELSDGLQCRDHRIPNLGADVIKEDEIQLPPEDEVESLPGFSTAFTTCGSMTSGQGLHP